MTNTISSIISGQPAYQTQEAAPAKLDEKETAAQPKSDEVTIST